MFLAGVVASFAWRLGDLPDCSFLIYELSSIVESTIILLERLRFIYYHASKLRDFDGSLLALL